MSAIDSNEFRFRPIVRWKQGEIAALTTTDLKARRVTTPIVEPIPKCYIGGNGAFRRQVSESNRAIATELSIAWADGVAYVDCHCLPYWVDQLEPTPCAVQIVRIAQDLGVKAIPVVRRGANRLISDIGRSNSARRFGVGLRLTPLDFELPTIAAETQRIVEQLGLRRSRIDLIVDYGQYYDGHRPIAELLALIEGHDSWRSVTLAVGAFPKDLSDFVEGLHELRRRDWDWWFKQSVNGYAHYRISFADYATQFAIFEEPPPGCNPSVSVRYPVPDVWLVSRGQGIQQGGSEQWYGHAMLISEHPKFMGADFSAGSHNLAARRDDSVKPGSFSTWVEIGINQHIAVTASQIAALNDTLDYSVRRVAERVADRIAARPNQQR